MLDGESEADFEALCLQLESRFGPEDPVAGFMVEQLAAVLWRLNRVAAFESALLSGISHREAKRHDLSGVEVGNHYFPGNDKDLGNPGRLTSTRAIGVLSSKRSGRMLEMAFGNNDLLGKVGRYEAHLLRQAERLLHQLERLRATARPGLNGLNHLRGREE